MVYTVSAHLQTMKENIEFFGA